VPALPFRDRTEAGRLLAIELSTRDLGEDVLVLALPRGGLPVAVEVAQKLNAPLDIIIVRKLGVPWQPELAMGALAGTTRILDHALIDQLRISDSDIDAVTARESEELERRERLYRGRRPLPVLAGRTVILVDDGLATGSTMLAAVHHVRSARPKTVIVAVPVASTQACGRFKKEADDCICLATPEPFIAVGEWYEDFRQVNDSQVQEILSRV
jgi:putative phosphoribosyl transferase